VVCGAFSGRAELVQVAYQRILQLTYVEDLLSAIKSVFLALYEPFLTNFVSSLHGTPLRPSPGRIGTDGGHPSTWDITDVLSGWGRTFDKLLKSIEDKVAQDRKSRLKGSGTLPQSVFAFQHGVTSADQEATSGFYIPFTFAGSSN